MKAKDHPNAIVLAIAMVVLAVVTGACETTTPKDIAGTGEMVTARRQLETARGASHETLPFLRSALAYNALRHSQELSLLMADVDS